MVESHNLSMPVRICVRPYESNLLALMDTVYYRELTSCKDNE